jgi:hypothetical protein
VPAGALHLLPVWAVLAVVAVGVLLTAMQVIVTQIVRLRASKQISSSRDALRMLEIEDLPRGQHCNPRSGHPRAHDSSRAHAGADRARLGRRTAHGQNGDEDSPRGCD